MTRKVVILNGPPGCGKDMLGEMIICRGQRFARQITIQQFKEPLFRIAAEMMNMSYHELLENYRNREWKESARFGDKSVRDLLIGISEDFCKPFFGEDYFGKIAAQNCDGYYLNLFTDGGFNVEVDTLIAAGYDVHVVHILRNGCDFSGDSRNYIDIQTCKNYHHIVNNGTQQEAVEALERILQRVTDEEWED